MLEANCDAVEEVGYSRKFPEEQIDKMKEGLLSVSLKIQAKETEISETNKEMKGELSSLKGERKQLLDFLKTRCEWVEEDCYKMIDGENREVGYYNKEGQLVYKRAARKEELQKTIFQAIRMKNGTEDK